MLTGLLSRLGELDADVLVDCGRLAGASPNPVLSGADQVVLAARPRLADLHALASFFETYPGLRQDPRLVLVGDGPYPDQEVAEALGVEVAARLPWDPDAAASLVSVRASARELRVAPLVRAARTLADQLSGDQARTDTLERAETPPAAPSRLRVMRAWRAEPSARSTNGSAPEEVPQ
jgi:Flp pilus assembly CpaE family ATPase